EAFTVKCTDGKIGPIATANHEIREVLSRVVRRNVVIAECVVERFGHRFEADAFERTDVALSAHHRPKTEPRAAAGTRLRTICHPEWAGRDWLHTFPPPRRAEAPSTASSLRSECSGDRRVPEFVHVCRRTARFHRRSNP